ncbi:TetR/AcrR family transcriptional regulator [Marivirga aurantiaca]|nr:TetR/AcrR family transcriptional regulator [Marivirga aurantiaca]
MPTIKVEKEEWLKLGVQKFAVSGADGLNVEQMAKQLKCNKSSFYWHFRSKENFLNDTILYWFEHSIKPFTKELNHENNPAEKFTIFLKLSFQDKSRKDFMFYLRRIAQSNHQLKGLLNSLRAKRLAFTCLLIRDLGYTQEEAEVKAEVLHNFYVGWYEQNKYKSTEQNDINHIIKLVKTFINF